jgi:hypothetical protein
VKGLYAVKMREPVRRKLLCLQSCASSTAVPQLRMDPCCPLHRASSFEKKKKKKRRGHQSACTRRKPPCTVGAACTARPEESEIEQRETVGSVLRTCKRHAAGTHRLRLQSSGPKRWTGGAALWALRCDAGEFGAVTVAVCCLLVATAFAAPGSPRGAHPTPPLWIAHILLQRSSWRCFYFRTPVDGD